MFVGIIAVNAAEASSVCYASHVRVLSRNCLTKDIKETKAETEKRVIN